MISDWLSSVRGNIVRRTTNPFLGTLLVVWIIRNWEFVYSLIYFDSSYSLENRLEFIELYFQGYGIWDGISTILLTFCVIISTYILLNASLLIVNFFDKKVKPFILKINDENSIVALDEYQALQKELEETRKKADEEKSRRLDLRRQVDDLEKRNVELQKLQNENKELLDIDEAIEVQDDFEGRSIDTKTVERIIDILRSQGIKEYFIEISGEILVGNAVVKENLKSFARLELIEPDFSKKTGNTTSGYYHLTKLGKKVFRHLIDERYKKDN